MPKKIEDIQQIVNIKAKNKLYNDIDNLNNALHESNISLDGMSINISIDGVINNIPLEHIFSNRGFRSKIFNLNIDRYIKLESIDFIDKVESIKEEIDKLLDNTINSEDN